MMLTEKQKELLRVIDRSEYWGGFYASDYRTWRSIKRLQARRLVKHADRCKRWQDQFWLTTERGHIVGAAHD